MAQKTLALVGISRGGRKFGNLAFRELRSKGYRVYPVHPNAATIDGERCWPDLASLPEPVGGVVLVVPPAATERVVQDAKRAGIPRVWMQQGSESERAVAWCEANGIRVVERECILMFTEPAAFPHKAHRWFWRILGKLPR
jgi:predicted CoA-binding protein